MPGRPYRPYLCLPYLILKEPKPLGLGPIRFYPSSHFDHGIDEDAREEMRKYLNHSPDANRGTSVCVDPDIPKECVADLIVDAVYLLYFSSTYKDLYHNAKPPELGSLTQYVPTSPEKTKDPANIQSLKALQLPLRERMEISLTESAMSEALGQLLSSSYQELGPCNPCESRRIIRSIRYFIHCFHDKFRNLLGSGSDVVDELFEPEDFLFLMTAFETLFDLDRDHPVSDLKQKLRPVIHLKFGRPMETIWKWVDGFFKIKGEIVHQGTFPDAIFRDNQSFEIPYLTFAMKLFIYSVYHRLYHMELLPGTAGESFMPLAFEGIEREEVITFLWPEAELLKKISILLMGLTHGKVNTESLLDVSMLALIYQNTLKYHAEECGVNGIHFIATPKEQLSPIIDAIENHAEEHFEFEGKVIHARELFPEGFLEQIHHRVA